MRDFPYITVGKILLELSAETRTKDSPNGLNLTNTAYGRLEKKLKFPLGRRSVGNWRVYSRAQCEEIKKKIKDNYGLLPEKKHHGTFQFAAA